MTELDLDIKEKHNMDAAAKDVVTTVLWGFGGVLTTWAVFKVFIEIHERFKKRRQAKLDKKNEVMNMLHKLCRGQTELDDRMGGISSRLDNMDKERQSGRVEDAGLRANLYLGQIAMIGAIRELAKHMGIEINGEVKKYYEINIDNLRRGVGMEPIHAKNTNAERADAAHIVIDESIFKDTQA